MNDIQKPALDKTYVYFERPDREYLIESYHKYGELLKAEKRLDWLFFDEQQLLTIEWWVLNNTVVGMAEKVFQVMSAKLDFPEAVPNQNEEN